MHSNIDCISPSIKITSLAFLLLALGFLGMKIIIIRVRATILYAGSKVGGKDSYSQKMRWVEIYTLHTCQCFNMKIFLPTSLPFLSL